MAAYGVTAQAVSQDVAILETAFATVQSENILLNNQLANLQAEFQQLKQEHGGGGIKMLSEKKGFERLNTYGGDEKGFSDWEFKLHQFIRSEVGFELFMDKGEGIRD